MNPGSVLLVEDNPDDELLTVRALQKAGVTHQIRVARNGAEALDTLLHRSDEPDYRELPKVGFLDLKLPKLDGIQVLKKLRAHDRTRYLPAVILTSSSQDEDIIRSYESGANSCVRKPVDFNRFTQAVGQLGVYWLLVNESSTRQVGRPAPNN